MLIDAAWFTMEEQAAKVERVSQAAKRLAEGSPAALLPAESEQPEKMVYLLTPGAPLAPYAGQTIKVEGRAFTEIRAFQPTALYVRDEHSWRQVQLSPAQQKSATEPQLAESAGAEHEHGAANTSAEHSHEDEGQEQTDESTTQEPESDESTAGDKAEHNHGNGDSEEHQHSHLIAFPPLHPLLVNFTAGLFPAAVLADWLGRFLRRQSLRSAAWWMLLFAAVVTPLTAVAGWFWYRQEGDMGHWQMTIHPWLGLALAILVPALAIWRGRINKRGVAVGTAYLSAATLVLLAIVIQGHLGATMSFSSGHETTAEPHAH